MITLPRHVNQVTGPDGWDGRSQLHGRSIAHKETEMDWAEHQRIVCEARSLMVRRPDLGSDDERARFVTAAFFELHRAYNENGIDLYVSKGIHQPTTNPHLQVMTRDPRGRSRSYTFHLVVTAVDLEHVPGRFQWVGTKFTVVDARHTYSWPLNVGNPDVKARRQSMSAVQLKRHVDAVNALRAAQQQAAQAVSAAQTEVQFNKAKAQFKADHKELTLDFGKTNPKNVQSGKAAILARGRGAPLPVKYNPTAGAFEIQPR